MIASSTQAQNWVEVFSSIPDLSKLAALLQPYTKDLENLTNITFVAPNNAAVDLLLNSSAGAALAADANLGQALMVSEMIECTAQNVEVQSLSCTDTMSSQSYHILNGTYPEYFGTSGEQIFAPTILQPPNWSNVTGGQRVEIVASSGNEKAIVISGLRQVANLANCTSFAGGDLYISDRFLAIPLNLSTTATGLNLTAAVGALTCFPGILQATNSYTDVTMFLPDNEAFQQVGGNLAGMTSSTLSQILEYHAVSSHVFYSPELQDGKSIGTLFGKPFPLVSHHLFLLQTHSLRNMLTSPALGNLTVTRNGSDIFINNAQIIQSDILTTNGVLHVIDRVLNPADGSASRGAQAFAQASSVTYVPFTSGIPTATSHISTTGYSTSTSVPNSSPNPSSSKSSSNIGAIAGGVVGGICGLVLILVALWFIRRKRSRKNDSNFGRKDTTKSYRKPELEATTRPELESKTRSELESTTTALSQSVQAPKSLAEPVVYEIGQIATPRTPHADPIGNTTDPHRIHPIASRDAHSQAEQQRQKQRNDAVLAQRQEEQARELQRQRDREEQEARMTEVKNQRRLAELDYQRRMTELEHEQRMAELNISAARIRSHTRTVSELEDRANPGPGGEE